MWTGVPLMQLAEAESQRLLKMEDELRKGIIGQEDAIVAISRLPASTPGWWYALMPTSEA